jgi:outer membrane protein OmpU
MKQLLVTTLSGILLSGAAASAQGIALFGDARLGLGYNIENDGGIALDDDDEPTDDLRAVSRVRFGVNMTGETDSGITFGASIRADNAEGGEGGTEGQTEGDVFVSGDWGTLSFGDVDGADYEWVGDVPGNFSLTGLTDPNETRFISNGGSFGEDNGADFAENPDALPTVRYDFDWEGFGFSLSTNRDLTDIGVGAGYAADFGGGSWSIGVGYYNFASFDIEEEEELTETIDIDGVPTEVLVPSEVVTETVPSGEQWSVGLSGEYADVEVGLTYMKLTSDAEGDGASEADELLLGAAYTFDAWSVGAFWAKVLSAEGSGDFVNLDGDDAYGLTAQYDLGGGATINAGVVNSYSVSLTDDESVTLADFGISMDF